MINYFNKLLNSINSSIMNLDCDRFELLLDQTVSTLKEGRRVITSGLGKNVPICDKFVGTMLSLGLDAAFLNTNSAVHGDLGVVRAGDLVLLLSKSGETQETAYLVDFLKNKDANLWLITFNTESSIIDTVDNVLVLDLDHEGDMWNIVPNNSTTLYLIILQALAINTAERMNVTLQQFKVNHPGGHIGVQLKNEKSN